MQIIFGIAIFIIVVTLILYKVNNRFEKKEFITQLSHIENHKFTIFKSFIKPHK